MKQILSIAFACAASVAFAVLADVTQLAWTQNGSSQVKVDYTLAGGSAFVAPDILQNGVSVSSKGEFAGDANKFLAAGSHSFTWKITDKNFVTNKFAEGSFSVKMDARRPVRLPDYMCIRLSDGSVSFYANAASVPDGVTNACYKSTHMLFRRIPAAGATARLGRGYGESNYASYTYPLPPYLVTFEDDYYIAVYEFTIGHYIALGNSYSGSYGQNAYSGKSHHADHQTDWQWHPLCQYGAGTALSCAATLQNRFRTATNVPFSFALPTEDEWEFACRAGCPRDLTMGTRGMVQSTYGYNNSYIANYQTCAAYIPDASKINYRDPIPVGRLLPNAWGLYDMLGNVKEFALRKNADGYVHRGGDCTMSGENSVASWRDIVGDGGNYNIGFRLVCHLCE